MRLFYKTLPLVFTAGIMCCADNEYETKGEIVDELLWESPGFGHVYKIYVDNGKRLEPFVFLGGLEELETLDGKYNIGDSVEINTNTTAVYSLSGDQVLAPELIRKHNL